MGYGRYSHDAHVALTTGRGGAAADELFQQRGCHELMDPYGVQMRESRDSEDHPESLGIVFALDVSGSMGEIPEKLATRTLPDFMQAMLDAGIEHPQVLFMGIGNAAGDAAPLQIGQFESTEKLMDQWLTWLFLEGGGGGGNESYELAMYFAARHTEMDCLRKRHRRGYLFITGDEPPNPVVSRSQVQRLIGDELNNDIPIGDIIEETQRSFELFYLIPDPERGQQVGRDWRDLLGERVIVLESPDDTSYAAAGLVSLLEEAVPSLEALVARLRTAGVTDQQAARVGKALTGFAAALGRDGTPPPALSPTDPPDEDGTSGYER
ncbi:MAG: VWA domain-containing protein [Pirellulaceae bacterium]|nr:VWA domain-containing protein [Pirellulaceae bacterium]